MSRLLVVSAEPELLETVARAVSDLEMQVVVARSVAEAAARTPSFEPSVVLVSTSATGGDAAEAVARLRVVAALRDAMFVLVGSSMELATAGDAFTDDVFETPCRAFEVAARLRNLARLHRAVAEIDTLRAQIAELTARAPLVAVRDERSGAYDRRYFELRLPEEIERSRRYGQPLSVVRVSLPDFLGIQEQHGRETRDEAFRALGATLQQTVRKVDLVARLHGAEFVVVAPNTDEAGARFVARRLESVVRELFSRRAYGPRRTPVTVRTGTATLQGRDGLACPSATQLLESAEPRADDERATA